MPQMRKNKKNSSDIIVDYLSDVMYNSECSFYTFVKGIRELVLMPIPPQALGRFLFLGNTESKSLTKQIWYN